MFFGDLKFNGFKSKHVQIVVSLATKQNLLSIKVNPQTVWEGLEGEAGGSNVWVYNNSPDRDFIKDAIARRTRLQLVRGSRGLHHKRVSRPNPFPSWKNKKFSHLPWGRISQRRTNSEAPTNFQICVRVYTHYPYFACVCVTFSNLQCRQGCGLFGLMAEKPIFTV